MTKKKAKQKAKPAPLTPEQKRTNKLHLAFEWLRKLAYDSDMALLLMDEICRLRTEEGKDLLQRMPAMQKAVETKSGYAYTDRWEQEQTIDNLEKRTYHICFVIRRPNAYILPPFIP